VVLDADQVQPDLLGEPGQFDHAVRLVRGRGDERAEEQIVAVVRHGESVFSYRNDRFYR
jgi:hypothetical protein